jgi:hypothetical protein
MPGSPTKVTSRVSQPAVKQSICRSKRLARRDAIKADKGEYQSASHLARWRRQSDQVRSEQLTDEEVALRSRQPTGRGAVSYSEYSRKTMSTQAFYTMKSRHEDTMVSERGASGRSRSRLSLCGEAERCGTVVCDLKDHTYKLTGDLIRTGAPAQRS